MNAGIYRGIATLALAASLMCALAGTEETISKKLPAQPGGTLIVSVEFGAVQVTRGSSSEVSVDAYRKITRSRKADEEAFLRDHPVSILSNDGVIRIESKANAIRGISFGWKNRNEGKYTITVPEQFNVRLSTSGGQVTVAEIAGDVKANTSGGGMKFRAVRGPIDAKTSGGGVDIADCVGDIKIGTSGGHFAVSGGSGTFEGRTSGGGVRVRAFEGPINVSSSGGRIDVSEVKGAVSGSTSGGAIEAQFAAVAGPIRLTTSGGSIKVALPENAAFDLDAETSGGSVNTQFPITISGKLDRNRLNGKVNGGGTPIYLRTSGGGISVDRR